MRRGKINKAEIIGFMLPIIIFFAGFFGLNNAPYINLDINITNNKAYLANYNNVELNKIGGIKVWSSDFIVDPDMVESQDDFFHYLQFHYTLSNLIEKGKPVTLEIVDANKTKNITVTPTEYPLVLIVHEVNLLLVTLFCLIIALILMSKKVDDIRIRVFLFLLYSSSSIFVSFAFWSLQSLSFDTLTTFFLLISNSLAFVYFPMLFLHFFLLFPAKRNFAMTNKFLYIFYSIPFFVFFFYFPRVIYELLQLVFLLGLGGGIGIMVYSFFTSNPIEKAQIKWVLWGTLLFTIIMMVTYVLPLLGILSTFYSYQIPAITFLLIPLTIALAISKYRLMDIDTLIDNTLIYVLTFSILIVLDIAVLVMIKNIVSSNLGETAAMLLALWVAITLYVPLRSRVTQIVRKILKRGQYDSQEIALRLAKSMIPEEKRERITQLAIEVLNETFHPQVYDILFVEEEEFLPKNHFIEFESVLDLRTPEYLFNLSFKRELPPLYASGVLAPIVGNDRLLGFVLLGEKESQQLYDRRDIKFIETVTTQVAIGIDGIRIKDIARRDKEKMIREIHDGIGGVVTNISMLSQMVKESDTFESVIKKISTISELSKDALFEIRSILQSLDISNSTSKELIETLRRYAATMLEPHAIRFSLIENIEDKSSIPNAHIMLNIFRIYREAFTNIVKYSQANNVESSIFIGKDQLKFSINDNGRGFDKESKGRGIKNMQQRAKEIGATFDLCSEDGVMIEIDIPFESYRGGE